jgi:hypothetical protein
MENGIEIKYVPKHLFYHYFYQTLTCQLRRAVLVLPKNYMLKEFRLSQFKLG